MIRTRRRFLVKSFLTILAALGPIFVYLQKKNPKQITFLGRKDSKEIKSLCLIGRSYISQFPKEDSIEDLCDLLEINENLLESSNNDLLEIIHLKVQGDFLEDRLVVVEDWILSRTEARIYALFSIVYG